MPDPQIATETTTTVVSILAGIAATGLWLRRKISADSVEVAKDRAEENIISRLEKERDEYKKDTVEAYKKLEKVENERNLAIAKVSELTVEVEHLTKQVNHLEDMVRSLGNKLDLASQQMTDYAIQNAKLSEKLIAWEELKCTKCVYNSTAQRVIHHHPGGQ